MKSLFIRLASTSLFVLSSFACKSKPASSGSSDAKQGKANEIFNLASYIRRNPQTSELLPHVAPGDPYLFFGSRDKFRLETNLTLEARVEPGFIGGTRGINASYWLDGFIFDQKIGTASKGYLIEANVAANISPIQAQTYIRVFGDDKFRGKLEAVFQQTYMRDLQIGAIDYAIPLLGIKAAGNIGGEISFRAALGARKDGTIGLSFQPRGNLHGVIPEANGSPKFTSVEAVGEILVMDLNLASSANIGYWPLAKFAYGSIGVDAGEIRALEGKLEIVAKVGVSQSLPSGVDTKLWQRIGSAIGLSGWEWRHLVWQPKAVFQAAVPAYGRSFIHFTTDTKTCHENQSRVIKNLEIHAKILQQEVEATEPGLNRSVLETCRLNMKEVERQVLAFCN